MRYGAVIFGYSELNGSPPPSPSCPRPRGLWGRAGSEVGLAIFFACGARVARAAFAISVHIDTRWRTMIYGQGKIENAAYGRGAAHRESGPALRLSGGALVRHTNKCILIHQYGVNLAESRVLILVPSVPTRSCAGSGNGQARTHVGNQP